MKKILIAIAAFVGFTSCSEDEIETFSGVNLVNVYGLELGGWDNDVIVTTDKIAVDFYSDESKKSGEVTLRVAISDVKSDKAKVVTLSYTGDFNPQGQPNMPKTVTIPAGKNSVDVPFEILRPAGDDAKLDNVVLVSVKEIDGFVKGADNTMTLDFGMIPSTWPAIWGWSSDYTLGDCSKTKYMIIYDLFGTYNIPVVLQMGAFDWNTQQKYVVPLKKFVTDYNDSSVSMKRLYGDAPLKDEKGNLIKIGF